MTRILLTTPARGGVWRYSSDLAAGFAQAGVEPFLAVLGPEPESETPSGFRVIRTGLPCDEQATSAAELREAGAVLAGLANRLGVATVHLHTPALAAEVAWAMPVVAVVHADAGVRWQAVHGGPLPEALQWRAMAVGHGIAEADAVLAPSRSFARALIRLYRPGRTVSVVPHGRDHLPLPPAPRQCAVLAAGRVWDDCKNLSVLDRAAVSLEAPVLAAGKVDAGELLAGEHSRLTLLGCLPQSALALRMMSNSVFAAPTRHAPFGLTVLEAAQAGMALALADIPVFRELWDGAALFFHPDDPAALADVLNRLLARPEAAAARAQRHAERYSVNAMVAATLAQHRALSGGGSYRGCGGLEAPGNGYLLASSST